MLPTFFGLIDQDGRAGEAGGDYADYDAPADERLGLVEHMFNADPVALWNRIMSPQGIATIIGINTLLVRKQLPSG